VGLKVAQDMLTLESALGAEIVIEGMCYVNFGGSSYLGLASNPQVIAAGCAALRESGTGTPMQRHQGVVSPAHLEVEQEGASFFDAPAALYLSNGYHFGAVMLAGLSDSPIEVFFDELAHPSLRDGIVLSRRPAHSYRHLDSEDLALQLATHLSGGNTPLIVTDGLYSTLGEIAPLEDLLRAAAPFGGRLLVDESHSFGVLGPNGRGACEHYGLSAQTALRGGSLGKAFAGAGGLVLGDTELTACRSTHMVLGESPGLPTAAAISAASLRYVREHPELLQRLRRNVANLKAGLRRLGLAVGDSVAPIASFTGGTTRSTAELREALMRERIFVYHSRYLGSGPDGVIRCGIFADHTPEHIERLLEALRRLL
jgi:8-amino-7-oxononanoate synthase